MVIKITTEQAITKFKLKHGDRYDYSKVVYRGNHSKVCIICRIHGEFWQTPANHGFSQGCPTCGKIQCQQARLGSGEDFIQKSIEKHGPYYDYSKVEYKGFHKKITIVCPKHGEFQQKPAHHINGHRCVKCGQDIVAKLNTDTFEDFIEKAKKIHGELYIYREYAGSKGYASIECSNHGLFTQEANAHLQGQGCPKCAIDARRLTLNEFLERAKNRHGETFDYSRVILIDTSTLITIICKKHGDFLQSVHHHIYSDWGGCPSCTHHYSTGHREIEAYLGTLGVSYQSNVRFIIPPKELDIYISSHNLAIEFNGDYWHSKKKSTYHQDKFLICQSKNVALLQIEEGEWRDIKGQEKWKNVIKQILSSSKESLEQEIILDNRYSEWIYYKDTHSKVEDLPPKFRIVGKLPLYDAGYQKWVYSNS